MAMPFPHHYDVCLTWSGDSAARISAGGRPSIEGGAPSEFGGSDAWWSPEHLLLSSVGLCFATTFQAFARRRGLNVDGLSCRAEVALEKLATGPAFSGLVLHVQAHVPKVEDEPIARQLLEEAKKHCIVGNALMPPVHLEATVVVSPAGPPARGRRIACPDAA
jgi:organic hydroperoxide reductase OsmC/OhrA